MQKWEYKREVFFGGDEIMDVLKGLGDHGWELCSMVFTNEFNAQGGFYHDMYFKRPIE